MHSKISLSGTFQENEPIRHNLRNIPGKLCHFWLIWKEKSDAIVEARAVKGFIITFPKFNSQAGMGLLESCDINY